MSYILNSQNYENQSFVYFSPFKGFFLPEMCEGLAFRFSSSSSLGLEEKIGVTSETPPCENSKECRKWEEIKGIANCKMGKLATLVPGKSFYYVSTELKTEAEEETAKFIYSAIDAEVENDPAKAKENPTSISVIRICVPVKKLERPWLDDKCPKDPCSHPAKFSGECAGHDGADFMLIPEEVK